MRKAKYAMQSVEIKLIDLIWDEVTHNEKNGLEAATH